MKLNDYTSYYFLGIGGIGMSAVARYLNQMGKKIYGYDRVRTELCKKLEQEGMEVVYRDTTEHLPALISPDNCLIIYTPAIPSNSMLLQHFKNKGFQLLKRSEILGLITADSFNISVAGTHGKTTTSALVAHMLHSAEVHLGAFLGGLSTNLGSNYFNTTVPGEKTLTVTEADEFDRSFLTLSPDLAVITSMDPDHLDIYGTGEQLKSSFFEFIHRIVPGGTLFLRNGLSHPGRTDIRLKTYGIESGDLKATNIRIENGWFVFDLKTPDLQWNNLKLGVPGNHNIENALAAIGIALELNLSKAQITAGLSGFKGVKRRFEFILRTPEHVYIDDYAHHPAELEAFIRSVRLLYPDKKITGIFQPHLYSRTRDFADGFAKSLSLLDTAVVLDIYPARELPLEGVTSDLIWKDITSGKKHRFILTEVVDWVKNEQPEVLLTMGAGDIDTLVEPIYKALES